MVSCRYGLMVSDSDEEADEMPVRRLTAEAKGKAAMYPVAKPAQAPRPRRGFTLQLSESDDDVAILEGGVQPHCASQKKLVATQSIQTSHCWYH